MTITETQKTAQLAADAAVSAAEAKQYMLEAEQGYQDTSAAAQQAKDAAGSALLSKQSAATSEENSLQYATEAGVARDEAVTAASNASEYAQNKFTFYKTPSDPDGTIAGLAATTNGQSFRVAEGPEATAAFKTYENQDGVAVLQASQPGTAAITGTIREFPTLAAAQADADAGNIQVGAICWVLNSSDNTLADEYANISGTLTATGRSIPSQSSINNHFTEQPRSAVALDFVGSNGRRASLCIAKSGRFITTGDGVDVADTISNIGKTIKLEASSIKYSFKITDASGRVACGLGLDGHPIIAGQRIEAYIPQIAWSNIPNSFSKKIDTDTTQLVAWGDSLTESTGGATSYPSQLATLLGRTVLNRGRGGQDVTRIIARQGGAAISCSVDGNSIPA
ncbi:hypothetical protein V4B82_25790, partial [Klebsiella pneumoniae]